MAVAAFCASTLFSASRFSPCLPHLQPLRPPRPPSTRRRLPSQPPSALYGGDTSGENEKDKKKRFITKEEEPDQYWQTPAEKEGKGPMSTVLPYIVIFGFLTPFIILAIAFANGWVKMPMR